MNVLFTVSQDPIANILQEVWNRQTDLPRRTIELRCVEDTKGIGHYAYYAVTTIEGVEVSRWLGATCEQALDSIADIAHAQERRAS